MFWYTKRLEHLHTLPQEWTLDDDFRRVLAWRKVGIDDFLEISVPWSIDPAVTWRETTIPVGKMDERYPVMIRDYATPAGELRHAVRKTGEDPGAGWVIQPDTVPLIEDYNIPRAIKHAVASPADVDKLRYLYMPPDDNAKRWFKERAQRVVEFAAKEGVPVQAWAGFGMDAVVWFCGTEGAVMLALDELQAFHRLWDIITETDLARVALASAIDGIDLVCERGWYSSTDFWSPSLFNEYVFPHVKQLVDVAHRHGKKFAYVMTTGVELLGPRLADAGVDLLYFIDPFQDKISLEKIKELLSERMTLVGGLNSTFLTNAKDDEVRIHVKRVIEVLGPSNRFILHPVDALFPDTPWHSVETAIKAWEEFR